MTNMSGLDQHLDRELGDRLPKAGRGGLKRGIAAGPPFGQFPFQDRKRLTCQHNGKRLRKGVDRGQSNRHAGDAGMME